MSALQTGAAESERDEDSIIRVLGKEHLLPTATVNIIVFMGEMLLVTFLF